MIIDWHVHAGEAEFFDRYPHYADVFRQFRDPFVRLYGVDIFRMMNQPLEAKLRMLRDAGVDLAVFIGLDLLPELPDPHRVPGGAPAQAPRSDRGVPLH